MIARLLFGTFILFGLSVWAKEDCDQLLLPPELQTPDGVLHELERLPPYFLDYQNLQESIENLMSGLDHLKSPYQNLKTLEKAFHQGNADAEAVLYLSEALAQKVARNAARTLDSDDRKTLEGERVLLSRLRHLQKRSLEEIEKKHQEESREDGDGDGDHSDPKKKDGSKDKSKPKQSNKDKKPKKVKISNEKLAKQIAKDLSEKLKKPAEPKDVDDKSDPEFKDLAEESSEKLVDELDEKKPGDPKDGKPEDGEPTPTEKAAKARLEKMAKEKAEKGKGKGKGKGKPGEGEPGEGDGEPGDGDGEPGEGKGDGKGERKEAKDGKQETREENGKVEDGNDGAQEGGGHGFKDYLESFNELLKKFKSDGELSERLEKITKEDLERLARQKKFDKTLERKPPEDDGSAEKPIPHDAHLHALEATMAGAWKHLLGQYQNSAKLLRQLADFSAVCQSLAVRYPTSAHTLKPFALRASDLAEDLQRLEVNYKDLEELGLSLSGGDAKAGSLRRSRFLNHLLSEKEKTGTLNEPENKTLQLARAILGASDKKSSKASEGEVIEALREQLLGPLSRRALESQFPATNDREDLNAKKAYEALTDGRVNDLVLYSRLAPYVNILLNDVYKPKYFERFEGAFVPINESDVVLERAEDFDDVPHVVREGNPSKMEILRLLAGDLLKNAYREKVRKSDPRKPIPKRASIILYDISGSMSSHRKQEIRNAIVTAFVDRSQTDVAKGEGEHTIYLVPFDGMPHQPRRVSSLAEAQAFFDEMRTRPLGSGGDDSITEGMVKAYEMIAEHQKNGGDLERANILLITDAVAHVDLERIERARGPIDPSVDLALNAITVGDWNQDVSEMIKKYAVNGNGEIGKVSHQHIPYEEIPRLLDVSKSVQQIVESAKDFSEKRNDALPGRVLDGIRGSVLSIAHQSESEERTSSARAERWIKTLEGIAESSKHSEEIQPFIDHFLEIVASSVGKDWTVQAKVDAWEEFLNLLESKTGRSAEKLLPKMSSSNRNVISRWFRK